MRLLQGYQRGFFFTVAPSSAVAAVSTGFLRGFIIQALDLRGALPVSCPCYALPHTEKERNERCQSGLGMLDEGNLKQTGREHGVLTFLLRFIYLSLPWVPISIYFHEVIILASS